MGNGKLFHVTRLRAEQADSRFPWFLQQVGNAEEEVTVAYIAGRCFASVMSRAGMKGEDSRQACIDGTADWHPCELSPDEEQRLVPMMRETGLSFARLDFLRIQGQLHFLEFNPNGQFAWIDIKDERGMLTCVADAIMRVHRLNLPEAP